MSPATKRQVRRAASTWLRSIFLYRQHLKKRWDPGKPYPTMVTLTLPVSQAHDDRMIGRSCLMPFLQRLKREHGIEQYLWRAEAQQNGNLHYHLIVDRFIDKDQLTALWSLSIDALEYRSRYFQQTGSLYPPCTEIHAIRTKVKNTATGESREVDPVDYLVDYFLEVPEQDPTQPVDERADPASRRFVGKYRRDDGTVATYITRGINGRVWGLSDGIRDLRPARATLTNRLAAILSQSAERRALRRVALDRAVLFFGPVHDTIRRQHRLTARLLTRYYLITFGHVYPKGPPESFYRLHPRQDPRGMWLDLSTFTTPTRIRHADLSLEFPTSQRAQHFSAAFDKYGT